MKRLVMMKHKKIQKTPFEIFIIFNGDSALKMTKITKSPI